MKICGIVCEYNPFHLGHLHQIARIREILGQDTVIICCMSGNFVQRGEGAILDKHRRAETAILGGADLVVALPTPYSLSSAEGFARGAVHILGALGVTHIAFGAEHAYSDQLMEIAAILLEKSTIDSTLTHMTSGISYAKARERALYDRISEKSAVISQPNNILAVEYCKAILSLKLEIVPIAIERAGVAHDGAPRDGFAAASYIRQLARGGKMEQAKQYLPDFSYENLQKARETGCALLDTKRLECAMLSRLAMLEIGDLARLDGASEGLEYRLYSAIHRGSSLAHICALAKTRRYAESRLRRMLLCGYLGIYANDMSELPQYIKVLGFTNNGRVLLREKRDNCTLPIITKPADGKAFMEKEALCTDLYSIALPNFEGIGFGSEWRSGIFNKKQ